MYLIEKIVNYDYKAWVSEKEDESATRCTKIDCRDCRVCEKSHVRYHHGQYLFTCGYDGKIPNQYQRMNEFVYEFADMEFESPDYCCIEECDCCVVKRIE